MFGVRGQAAPTIGGGACGAQAQGVQGHGVFGSPRIFQRQDAVEKRAKLAYSQGLSPSHAADVFLELHGRVQDADGCAGGLPDVFHGFLCLGEAQGEAEAACIGDSAGALTGRFGGCCGALLSNLS